jgi:hypothetical protein
MKDIAKVLPESLPLAHGVLLSTFTRTVRIQECRKVSLGYPRVSLD